MMAFSRHTALLASIVVVKSAPTYIPREFPALSVGKSSLPILSSLTDGEKVGHRSNPLTGNAQNVSESNSSTAK